MKCRVKIAEGGLFGDPYPIGYEMVVYINGEIIGSTIIDIEKDELITLLRKAYKKGFKDGKDSRRKQKQKTS